MRLWSLSQRNFSSSKSHHKRPPKHNPYARARDREEPPQMKRKRGLKRLRFELRRTVTQIKSQLIPSLAPYKSFSFIGRTIILGLLALYMFRYLQRSQSLIREFKVEDTGRPNFSHTLGLEKKVDDILKKNRGD
ncbi:unnamed protein product [Moneuplotes crassus]|uniref:Uncharacterized protein n=1 Tax=Euplotes crassus TaxID=5936 RepID=A0AAD1Y5D9_EUPCR|nr:unnamed protein product [Moneuplotes crassus]